MVSPLQNHRNRNSSCRESCHSALEELSDISYYRLPLFLFRQVGFKLVRVTLDKPLIRAALTFGFK